MSGRRFTFRLDRVARVREAAEHEARAEMGREQRRFQLALERADEARVRARTALDQLARVADPAAHIAAERVTAALAARAQLLRSEAESARVDAEAATERWRLARIEAESIGKLRAQAQRRFRDEVAADEEKERDELTMQRFATNSGPGRSSGRRLKAAGKNFR